MYVYVYVIAHDMYMIFNLFLPARMRASVELGFSLFSLVAAVPRAPSRGMCSINTSSLALLGAGRGQRRWWELRTSS